MDKITVVVFGAGLIGFVWWFFFGKKDDVVAARDRINILVSGGYTPENIKIKNLSPTKLIFKRTDKNPCLDEVVIPDFKIKKYLPLGENVEITITPNKPGIYPIHCGMNMFHGKIIVSH